MGPELEEVVIVEVVYIETALLGYGLIVVVLIPPVLEGVGLVVVGLVATLIGILPI